MNQLVLIAAIGQNNELGRNNTLIWNLKEDMQFFKKQTVGKPIIMGRKTLESLPRLLPDRQHIVLTRQNINIPGVIIINDKGKLLNYIKTIEGEVMVIGGASVYTALINEADTMLLTEIDDTCSDADTYFPTFNKDEWEKNIISVQEENKIKFTHIKYTRKLTKKAEDKS